MVQALNQIITIVGWWLGGCVGGWVGVVVGGFLMGYKIVIFIIYLA